MLWWTLRKLKSNNHRSRAKAARELALAGPLAVDVLNGVLETDTEETVRFAAAQSLAEIGDRAAVPAILEAFLASPLKSDALAASLDKLDPEWRSCPRWQGFVAELMEKLVRERASNREAWAGYMVGRFADPSVVPRLLGMIREPAPDLPGTSDAGRDGDRQLPPWQKAIAQAVASIAGRHPARASSLMDQLVDAIASHFTDSRWQIRCGAIELLARECREQPRVFDVLLPMLSDARLNVSRLAATVLQQDERIFQELGTRLRRKESLQGAQSVLEGLARDSIQAQHVVGRGGDRAFGVLVELLRDELSSVRKYAATILGSLGDQRAVGPLREIVETDPASSESYNREFETTCVEYPVRIAAKAALKKIGTGPR